MKKYSKEKQIPLMVILIALAIGSIILFAGIVNLVQSEAKGQGQYKIDEQNISKMEASAEEIQQSHSELEKEHSLVAEKQIEASMAFSEVSSSVDMVQTSKMTAKENLDLVMEKLSSAEAEATSLQGQIEAMKQSVAESKAVASSTNIGKEDRRTVYLTFDDGPSYLTPKVLDILDQYGIKATFFVIYKNDPSVVPYYSEIVKRGHTIAIHTASHDYDYVYGSYDNFTADFNKIYNYVYDLTGVKCTVSRFPGGSNNLDKRNPAMKDSVKGFLNSLGIVYFDWNVSCGDGSDVTAEQVYQNVVTNVPMRNHPLVLMHDGDKKETTVEALPRVIATLQAQGYQFAALNASSIKIQQGTSWDPE